MIIRTPEEIIALAAGNGYSKTVTTPAEKELALNDVEFFKAAFADDPEWSLKGVSSGVEFASVPLPAWVIHIHNAHSAIKDGQDPWASISMKIEG
tara:strand:- start:728 stop:1012 length:285 start_codon:yes stop_codon:yes gene_type:complete